RHDDGVQAEAALGSLLVDERLLNRMWTLDGAEPLERRDLCVVERANRGDAGANGSPTCDHGAGSTLAEAAAEFRAAQVEIVAQHVKERRCRVDVKLVGAAVDFQNKCTHIALPGGRFTSAADARGRPGSTAAQGPFHRVAVDATRVLGARVAGDLERDLV